jgi:hypothetical protein
MFCQGRDIAQAVSRRLPTAAARVRAQVRSYGVCGGQSGTGAGFHRVFRFHLPLHIPPTAPHSSSIIWGWYNRPISGRRTKWTQSRPTPRNLKKNLSQAVSRRIVIAEAWVPAQLRSRWICDVQSGTEAGFLRVLRLPHQFSFHQLLHYHLSVSGGGTVCPLVTDVPSGRILTTPCK